MSENEYHNSTAFFARHDGESMHRLLASAENEKTVDYAIFSVFVITLTLVLVVEVMRRSLDGAAFGHVYFQTVLELIYREVTTLGIVELCLHLMHTCGGNMLNPEFEAIFVDVHFMLFYTAIFNAIQSCIVRLKSVRRIDKTWLMTEEIEICHYVAIRREFDRLERKLRQEKPRYVGGIAERAWPNVSFNDVHESISSSCWESLHGAMSDIALRIRHPRLYKRRSELLTIIHFHELRVHFIESNKLPPKFKVSSYLERSLSSALLDFVHISPVAWGMFMATANMLLFTGGIILNKTESEPVVREIILDFFLYLILVFLVIVIVLYFKMRYIFYKIQQLKLSDQSIPTRRPTLLNALHDGTTEFFDQLDLFWGSNPHIVIAIIQYMQFGYAIILAGVLSFYEDWKDNPSIPWSGFLLLVLLSYSIFIKLTSEILPWYTLCTSMGQLVNKEILHETVAKLRLSEEIRKKESLEEEENVEREITRRRREIDDKNANAASRARNAQQIIEGATKASLVLIIVSPLLGGFDRTHQHTIHRSYLFLGLNKKKTQSDGVHVMRASMMLNSSNKNLVSSDSSTPNDFAPQVPTAVAPQSEAMNHWSQLEPVYSREKDRLRKSASDDVALMRALDSDSLDDPFPHDPLVRSIKVTDIASGNLESLINDHPDLSLGMKEEKRLDSLAAGVAANEYVSPLPVEMSSEQLIAFSKLTESPEESSESKAIFSPEPPPDVFALDDDGESDIDDVPKVILPHETPVTRKGRMQALAKGIDIISFFQTSQYRIMSIFFGPMLCFWIIARVYMFNISEGLMIDQTEIWFPLLDVFFWFEVSSYFLMIIEMLLVLSVFLNKRDRGGSLSSCAAAVFGLMIILLCMLLLFMAESNRCCHGSNYAVEEIHQADVGRLLASEPSNNDNDPQLEEIECCPAFGTRRYGGLGNIEPFTSLIVFYPMRFIIASCIVALFGNVTEEKQHKEEHKSSHHGHHGLDLVKMRDFWLTAIGVHSEVAEMFGLFSGEMLQCMLGIYSKKNIDDYKELETSCREDQITGNNKIAEHEISQNQVLEEEPVVDRPFGAPHPSPQLADQIQSFCISSTELPSQMESPNHPSGDFAWNFDDFAYPMARLIRRMRRCERLLLPLFDEWIVVDAALTSHELIFFSVLDDTEDVSLAPDHRICSLISGGKGLHLCDVAKGRRLVSQFNLDEIVGVDIEHRVAITQRDISCEDVEVNQSNLLEHWQGGDISSEVYEVSSMSKRWRHVNEDRLVVRFKHHTLFLRFMADLKVMEQKSTTSSPLSNSSNILSHVGAEAKVWCRTIARLRGLRGVSNLRTQNVPHSGGDFADEIEDFVKICDKDNHEEGHNSRNFAKIKLSRTRSDNREDVLNTRNLQRPYYSRKFSSFL